MNLVSNCAFHLNQGYSLQTVGNRVSIYRAEEKTIGATRQLGQVREKFIEIFVDR